MIHWKSRGVMAAAVAAFATSVIGMLAVVIGSLLTPTGAPIDSGHFVAMIGITLFWAPAIAFIPAAILGFTVERPKARAMIARGRGGFVVHLLTSVTAGAILAIVFRFIIHLLNPMQPILDPLVIGFFTLIGFCSGVAWWLLVVLPGRRV